MLYVNNIVITGNDVARLSHLNKHLGNNFQTKDFGSFMSIEVGQSKEGVIICKRKCALDIPKETSMIDRKLVHCPMDPNAKLMGKQEPFSDPK